jgi:hypothetical protein
MKNTLLLPNPLYYNTFDGARAKQAGIFYF